MLLSLMISAQASRQPLEIIESSLQLGYQSWDQGDFDEALTHFQHAQQTASHIKHIELWALSTFQVGKTYARTSQLKAAVSALDSVVALEASIGQYHPAILLSKREKANLFLLQGDFLEAIQLLEALVQNCEASDLQQDSIRAMCYNTLGHAYLQYENYEKALASYQKSMDIRKAFFPPGHLQIAYSENAMGMIHGYLDHYDQSLVHYLEAEAIFSRNLPPSHPNLVQIRTNIAIFYADMGQFWRSLSFHKKNLPYLEGLPPRPRIGVMLNTASMLLMVRDYEESLNYLSQVETLIDQLDLSDLQTQAYIADERAKIYRDLNQYERALEFIDTAMLMSRELYGPSHLKMMPLHMRKGLLLSWYDQYEASILSFQTALDLLDANKEWISVRRGLTLEYLAEAWIDYQQPQQGIRLLHQAESMYKQTNASWNLVGTYLKKAIAYRQLGQLDSCLHMHQHAWKIGLPEVPFSPSPSEEIMGHWQSHDLKDLLVGQAQTYHWQYQQSHQVKYLQTALDCYESAIAVVDSQRHYYMTTSSKQAAVRYQLPMYEAAIEIAWELYQQTGETQIAEQAWVLAEKSKANILRDHIRSMKAMKVAGIPDSLLRQEQEFRQQLAAKNQSFLQDNEGGKGIRAVNSEGQIELNRSYRHFLTQLEKDYPNYYRLKYPEVHLSVQKLSTSLAPQQMMYSYFMGEKMTIVFRLNKGVLSMFRIPAENNIQAHLDRWLSFISAPPVEAQEMSLNMAEVGHQLFQLLLPELSTEAQQLLIISDKKLGYLPFETLLSAEIQEENRQFRRLPYVGKQYAVSYSYSGELWIQQAQLPDSKAAGYLGLAPDFDQDPFKRAFPTLTYNQQEVEEVARMLRGDMLLEHHASESAIKDLNADTRILHFATHALTAESNSMDAAIFLHPDSSRGEDGILSAGEIYGLNLNSPLIVLSACQTGKGPLLEGEGLMSLARAFQFAGGQRILTTLWRIDDQAAATLSIAFFRQLANDIPIAQALHQARNSWLLESDNHHCHPYYWASFVLIGDGGRVEISSSDYLGDWGIFWLIIAFLLLGFVMFVRVKKS